MTFASPIQEAVLLLKVVCHKIKRTGLVDNREAILKTRSSYDRQRKQRLIFDFIAIVSRSEM